MSSSSGRSPEDFAARLRARLDELGKSGDEGGITVVRANLRKAAALLSVFEPSLLRIPGYPSHDAEFHLVDDATSVSGQGTVRWKLRPDVRTAALRSFQDADEALTYLDANIGQAPAASTARIALAYLRHEPPDLERLDSEDLARVRKAVRWLREVKRTNGLPDLDDIGHLLDRSRLLDPLRFLVSLPFAGRRRELAVLEDHFGLDPSTLRGRVSRAGRTLLRTAPTKYPLVVYGPGGIGKSTLLARCLIDHLTGPQSERFPFTYVDSERATISLDEPMTLVAEMARQLAVQYPRKAEQFSALSVEARALARDYHDSEQDVDGLREVPAARTMRRTRQRELHATARERDRRLMLRLGSHLRDAVRRNGLANPPFVVVLDSFEEAQYRGSPVLDRTWVMLTALRRAYPQTRVAVAGRAPVGHPTYSADEVPVIELGELDPLSAEQFLRDRDVPEPLAREIMKRVGGSPLSLRLAAKAVATSSDPDGRWLSKVPSRRRRFWTSVDDMLIRGVLYDRILTHIKDPDVRRLAHPGLALRWITPELIRVVLAPAVGMKVDKDQAGMLFDAFTRELDLVEQAPTGELVHRPDVRKVMLRLIAADRESVVRNVELRAIEFHAASEDPRSRAEELYHRLRAGGRQSEIMARWTSAAAGRLKGCEDELPARGAQLLARLIHADGDVEIPDDDAEQQAVDEAENLITQGFLHQALEVITAVPDPPPCSTLHVLHGDVLSRLDDVEGARRAIEAALSTEGVTECGDTYLELLQLSADLAARRGDLAAADDDLMVAEQVARRLDRELDAVSVLLQRARLLDGLRGHEVTDALVSRVRALSDEMLASQPTLARAVAAAVGSTFPDVLEHVLRLVGMPRLSDRAVIDLAKVIVRAVDDRAVVAALAGTADDEVDKWRHPTVGDIAALITASGRAGRLNEMAQHLLVADGDARILRKGIVAAMDEGSPNA